MNKPMISIVLPSYNVENYIERCIKSCLNQNFKDFEVVIVDDCGSDNSIGIAREWATKDSRIRIVHHDRNLGTYHARHSGVINSKGKFILFLDPDDEIKENTLSILEENIRTHSRLDIIMFDMEVVKRSGLWERKSSLPEGLYEKKQVSNIFKNRFLTYGTPGKLYLKEVIQYAFDTLDVSKDLRLVYGEDALVFSLSASFSDRVLILNERLYIYYKNEESITNQVIEGNIKNNISQLDFVVNKIKKCINGDNRYILERAKDKLSSDRLALLRLLSRSKFDYIVYCYNIFLINKNYREVFRIIFIFFGVRF